MLTSQLDVDISSTKHSSKIMLVCVTLKIKHLIRSCEWVKIRKEKRVNNKAHERWDASKSMKQYQ